MAKKYGIYYFAFTILFGVHAIPAAWTVMYAANPEYAKLYGVMVFDCLMVITAALFGLYTLKNYDNDPIKAEKNLLIEYSIITCGALGGGCLEGLGVIFNFLYKTNNGVYKDYGNTPDPLFGHTVYDLISETFGLVFFCAFAAIVWFCWPIKILQDHANETSFGIKEEDETAYFFPR